MNAALISERIVIKAPRHEEFVVAGCLQDYLSRHYVAIVFVYEGRVALDGLASALASTLEAFPIFAGSIETADMSIRITCDNRGVALSRTEYAGSYATLAAEPLSEQRRVFLDLPSSQWVANVPWPLLTLRVCHFADGHTALGFCWHHAIGDTHSLALFAQALSQALAGEAPRAGLIVRDRAAYLSEHLADADRGMSSLRRLTAGDFFSFGWHWATGRLRRAPLAFHFTALEIAALKQALSAGEGVGSSDAIFAHMFSLLHRFGGRPLAGGLSFALNYRAAAGLPSALIGNFVDNLYVDVAGDLAAPRIAAKIRRSVREHQPSYWPTLRLFEATGGRGLWPSAFNPMRATLYNSNWSKLGLYDVRLDKRAPLYVFPLSDVPFPWTSCTIESYRNQGRQFIVVVPPNVARRMRRPEVLAQVHAYRPDAPPGLFASAESRG